MKFLKCKVSILSVWINEYYEFFYFLTQYLNYVLWGSLIGMLIYGGLASLSHLILRFVLLEAGTTPWNYVRFLSYCTERIFLRRVGGGYIFVHRLLMEHFAEMYVEEKSQ